MPGLSLQTAIVDAGPSTFGPGMTYVGLSRVTILHGLHLVDLERKKIACDLKAIEEYNRLRKLYTPHLGELLSAGHNLLTATAGHQSAAVSTNKSNTTEKLAHKKRSKTYQHNTQSATT